MRPSLTGLVLAGLTVVASSAAHAQLLTHRDLSLAVARMIASAEISTRSAREIVSLVFLIIGYLTLSDYDARNIYSEWSPPSFI